MQKIYYWCTMQKKTETKRPNFSLFEDSEIQKNKVHPQQVKHTYMFCKSSNSFPFCNCCNQSFFLYQCSKQTFEYSTTV